LTSKAKTNAKQSHSTEAHPVVQLQRSLGNKAIGSMLSAVQGAALPAGVQAKMTVGPAGDAYEQEADQVGKLVADKISSSPDGGQSVQRDEIEEESEELQMKRAPEGIQRDEIEEESEELQMKRAPEGIQRGPMEEEEPLQLKRSEEGFDADASLEQQIELSRGNGSSMDTHVQAKMESAFDTGFEDVNIHTDGKADQMAQSIGASAFTTGSDIFFRQGQYNPGSRQGQELLGHELTHVVQQRGGSVPNER
jgi:hypothetical protein